MINRASAICRSPSIVLGHSDARWGIGSEHRMVIGLLSTPSQGDRALIDSFCCAADTFPSILLSTSTVMSTHFVQSTNIFSNLAETPLQRGIVISIEEEGAIFIECINHAADSRCH